MILTVALPTPLFRCFDYLPPEHIPPNNPQRDLLATCETQNPEASTSAIPASCQTGDAIYQPGQRILVPFGPRKLIGIIISTNSNKPDSDRKLRPAIRLLDTIPSLPSNLMDLLNWASHYYCHPIGDCFSTALPGALKDPNIDIQQALRSIELSKWIRTEKAFQGRPNAHKQKAILNYLENKPDGVWLDTLKAMNFTLAQLKKLEKDGYLHSKIYDPLSAKAEKQLKKSKFGKDLNQEQANAVEIISNKAKQTNALLLQGVTGSGKTEVYIEAVKRNIAQGKQALILIPEINLSPQTLQRFENQLQTPIGVIHSAMSHREKLASWHLAKEGIAQVIIGTRSAIFTPFKSLGLIVVDEEHDASYKQIDNFKYSARDLAVKRGQIEDCQVVLGSATPSLESLHNAYNKRYELIELTQRAGAGKKPEMHLLDIRSRPLEHGCSRPLKQRIGEELSQGNQVIIFQNRRGFSPTLMCNGCGWLAQCPHCDARLTVHSQPPRLHCHHCNYRSPIPHTCPECSHNDLAPLGAGTERIEYGLQASFPDYKVTRVDRDTIKNQKDMKSLIEDISKGEPCLLIGTQMLAKGHDFHNVTLVAIIDADSSFFCADYRAIERSAQQLIQVAGRTGRGEKAGTVIIQTKQPEHPLFEPILANNYSQLARNELKEREYCDLPPYSKMISIRAESDTLELGFNELNIIQQSVLKAFQNDIDIQISGPIEASIARKAGIFRCYLHIFISKTAKRSIITNTLRSYLDERKGNKARLYVDADPLEYT